LLVSIILFCHVFYTIFIIKIAFIDAVSIFHKIFGNYLFTKLILYYFQSGEKLSPTWRKLSFLFQLAKEL